LIGFFFLPILTGSCLEGFSVNRVLTFNDTKSEVLSDEKISAVPTSMPPPLVFMTKSFSTVTSSQIQKTATLQKAKSMYKIIELQSDASRLRQFFDRRRAHEIEIWVSVVADSASFYTAGIMALLFTSDASWATCIGATTYLETFYRILIGTLINVVTQYIVLTCEIKYVGVNLEALMAELRKIHFGARTYMCFVFMVCGAWAMILGAEAGFYGRNECFVEGRMSR
jgi:hypothetical protein